VEALTKITIFGRSTDTPSVTRTITVVSIMPDLAALETWVRSVAALVPCFLRPNKIAKGMAAATLLSMCSDLAPVFSVRVDTQDESGAAVCEGDYRLYQIGKVDGRGQYPYGKYILVGHKSRVALYCTYYAPAMLLSRIVCDALPSSARRIVVESLSQSQQAVAV
jgi:hypothetical protein